MAQQKTTPVVPTTANDVSAGEHSLPNNNNMSAESRAILAAIDRLSSQVSDIHRDVAKIKGDISKIKTQVTHLSYAALEIHPIIKATEVKVDQMGRDLEMKMDAVDRRLNNKIDMAVAHINANVDDKFDNLVD
ncbi:hypothetical protein ACHAPU_000650 [Fusarium lateritium]